MSWFNRNKRDIEFVDKSRQAYTNFPVLRAKDIRPISFEHQKRKYGKHVFAHCPGTQDLAEMGYIIPAWVDIHIMANKAGVSYFIGSKERGDRGFAQGRLMDPKVIDGIFPVHDVPLQPIAFGAPWSIHTGKQISGIVQAAVFHSNFLDDLHVVPGIVDYKQFHTLNFICVPKRECEVHIKAGDPLLQIIPFWNKPMVGGYGPGTDEQLDATKNNMPGDDPQYYRRYYQYAKKFVLEMFK